MLISLMFLFQFPILLPEQAKDLKSCSPCKNLLAFFISSAFSIPFAVPLWAVISAFLVTSVVGLFAGIYPAAKASKLDPIVALRYE